MIRVYVDMVGDLFHHGHVALLKRAREMGDYLLAGVASDEMMKSIKHQPILTMEERIPVIAACR